MTTRHSINGLVEVLTWMESKGYERSDVLRNTGIDPERLNDPNGTASNKEELTFYQNLLDISADPHIYLKAGLNLNIGTYGLWGLAILSSPTFGKAIEFGIQYIAFTYTFNEVLFFNEATRAGLRISSHLALGSLQKPMVERDIAAIYMIFKALLQTDSPLKSIRVTWNENNRKESALYQQLFQCPVTFSCTENEVLFEHTLINHELSQKKPLTMKMCQQHLDQRLPEIKTDNSTTAQVKQYFIRTPAYKVNIDDCANELKISTRHLARLLSNDGQSFKGLTDQFKQTLAKRYLTQTNIRLEEIAVRIGYSDAASFSHAFKRWTGDSPKKFRIKS